MSPLPATGRLGANHWQRMPLLTPGPDPLSSILTPRVSFQGDLTDLTRMHPLPKAPSYHWLPPAPTQTPINGNASTNGHHILQHTQHLRVALYCYYHHADTLNLLTFFHLRIWNCDFWQICSWFPILMQHGQISPIQSLPCVTIVNSPGSVRTIERYRTND